jgi:succinate dehydrogenase / fumarate reductase cytochrome b subunit
MAETAPGPRPRPISPQVQLNGGIWRWHITMAASILHRATGMALYVGALVMMAWALALASGPDAYGVFTGLAGSLIGRVVFIGLTLAVFYHLANGIRHLFWDMGYGFKPQVANQTAWTVIVFAIVATAGFWALLLFGGAR